jgi:predicted O-linked N-acetylglucosamine transferase (SPINDLY family)
MMEAAVLSRAETGLTHADAHALLAAGRFAEARAVLLAASGDIPADPVALLNLAIAEAGAGDPERAASLIAIAEAAYPDWDEPPLRRAELLRAQGCLAEAEAAFRRVIALAPARAEALLALGALLLHRDAVEAARPYLLRACRADPARAEAWDALGLTLLRLGDAASAWSCLDEARRLAPCDIRFALHRAEAAQAGGRAEAEHAALDAACAADPLDAASLAASGLLAALEGDAARAADRLEAACAIAPDSAPALALLGGLHARMDRLGAAETALRAALRAAPGDAAIGSELATVLLRLHRPRDARDLLRDLCDRHGANAAWLANLATATVSLGLQAEGEAFAREAIALAPDAMAPRRALCNVLPYRFGTTAAEMLAATRACAARMPRAAATANAAPDWSALGCDATRRLRVGLLSGGLRTHPVGWLTVAGLEALDRETFEIVCFSTGGRGDCTLARRFRALAAAWHDVGSLDDAALAAFARAQRIDVLLELGGHGDSGRLAACAQRLAPVQIKWVGMQTHSTGLAEMDWFLTDRWSTPDALAAHYVERPLTLPDGYVCYAPPAYAPDVAALPARALGHVTFGCFNNLAKLTPETMDAWAAILTALPAARLALKTHQLDDQRTRERLRAGFAFRGIAADRLDLRGASPHRRLLEEYADIDIALDPFPYSGGLTTCEALWMGVPVVTMPGALFCARHSASHLSNVGLADWIAPDREAYVARAIAASSDLASLAALRAGLRARMAASPLCDAPRFGRALGEALRHAWSDWCAQ